VASDFFVLRRWLERLIQVIAKGKKRHYGTPSDQDLQIAPGTLPVLKEKVAK
jgi:hypothetical protein